VLVVLVAAFWFGGDGGPGRRVRSSGQYMYVRHCGLEPVFDRFARETGITVGCTTERDAAVRERLPAEDAWVVETFRISRVRLTRALQWLLVIAKGDSIAS